MSVEVREYCDCCRRDISIFKDGAVIRGSVKREWRWRRKVESVRGFVVCDDCWRAVGRAVAASNEEAA